LSTENSPQQVSSQQTLALASAQQDPTLSAPTWTLPSLSQAISNGTPWKRQCFLLFNDTNGDDQLKLPRSNNSNNYSCMLNKHPCITGSGLPHSAPEGGETNVPVRSVQRSPSHPAKGTEMFKIQCAIVRQRRCWYRACCRLTSIAGLGPSCSPRHKAREEEPGKLAHKSQVSVRPERHNVQPSCYRSSLFAAADAEEKGDTRCGWLQSDLRCHIDGCPPINGFIQPPALTRASFRFPQSL
jgi:hypothetical protein